MKTMVGGEQESFLDRVCTGCGAEVVEGDGNLCGGCYERMWAVHRGYCGGRSAEDEGGNTE